MKKHEGRKSRFELRKHHETPRRQNDLTRQVGDETSSDDHLVRSERVTRKGEYTRRRTLVTDEAGLRAVDIEKCLLGRVIRAVSSQHTYVQHDQTGRIYECVVRGVLLSLATEERNVVVAGDNVLFQPVDDEHGIIERIEPRQGVLSREHQNKEHVLVANITQVLVVCSADQPPLKPALIDRFLVSAAKGQVEGLICINKCDLVKLAELQPLVGLYSRLGYPVVCTSVNTGLGIERLKQLLRGQQTVLAGQSGVGKTSLLNALQPGLGRKTGEVSKVTQKGRHTTRTAELCQLSFGGWIVDTPGIRQLALWDVKPEEIAGFFREFLPFAAQCPFSNCLHLEEDGCVVRDAVQRDLISRLRYQSYIRLVLNDV